MDCVTVGYKSPAEVDEAGCGTENQHRHPFHLRHWCTIRTPLGWTANSGTAQKVCQIPMAISSLVTAALKHLGPKLLSSMIGAKTVVIPPDRIAGGPSCEPIKPHEAYCRLRVVEALCAPTNDPTNQRGHLLFAVTQFTYAGKSIRIPLAIPVDAPQSGSVSTGAIDPILPNWEISPLFPYRGGAVGVSCALYSIEAARVKSSIKLVQELSKLLLTPRFPQLLEVADVLSTGIAQLLSDAHSAIGLGWFQSFSSEETGSPSNITLANMLHSASTLRAGYIAVIGSTKSRDVAPAMEEKQLCVVHGRLRLSNAADFEHDNRPLPSDGVQYLLVQVEKCDTREGWSSLAPLSALAQQAAEAAQVGDTVVSSAVLRSAMAEAYRSPDLTRPDRRRLIEAFKKLLETSLAKEGAVSATVEAAKTVTAVAKESSEIVAAREKLAATLPYSEPQGCVMSIEFEPHEPIRISVKGELNHPFLPSNLKLSVNVSREGRRADAAFAGEWRFHCRTQGAELYRALLQKSEVFEGLYGTARGKVQDQDLHLRFVCPFDYLRIPFEFLVADEREHLVRKHPLTRSVGGSGAPITFNKPPSVKFFNGLFQRREKLSVLLMASNTKPELPHVDDEVNAIAEALRSAFPARGIDVDVKTLLTKDANLDNVSRELKGQYHIVHYAGHARYSERSPEESCLLFWEKENRTGEVKGLKVDDLARLLASRRLGFVFLSCCVGVAQGDPVKLEDNDFLGIGDGILRAGVPAVLGYRWLAMDSGSSKLATSFYRALAEHGELDSALLAARNEQPLDDRSWISPILIVQS